jgi:uncharacterized protein (DUF433 family)
MKSNIICSDPERMSGVPVFRGTRVPIQVLFDCLQYDSLEDFLEGFPSVSREMVDEFFGEMRQYFSMDKDWLDEKIKAEPLNYGSF